MSRLCIDAELLKVAAAMWLRLSGQNGMPDDSPSETCIQQQWKQLATLTFSDWTSQPKTPQERSLSLMYRFTTIKHIFSRSIMISLNGLTALTGLTGLTAAELAFVILSISLMPKKKVCPRHNKTSKICGKKHVFFFAPKPTGAKCPY